MPIFIYMIGFIGLFQALSLGYLRFRNKFFSWLSTKAY